MSIINFVISLFHLIQIMKYLTVVKQFGNIIDLSIAVLGQVSYFLVFYLLWIMMLAVTYGILGITVDKDEDHPDDGQDYERMSRFIQLLFFTFRNSVGDLIVPDASYWNLFKHQENYGAEKSLVMVGILWFVWVFNIFYMVIILLNFLISMVSKAHQDAIDIQEETSYIQKCELNYEYDAIKGFFGQFFSNYEQEKDIFVVAASFKDEDEEHIQHA